jgi:prepilin-type N-terminal cleavage/methylation domain-containing protein
MADSRHNRALTLIEMLVVLGIIVVLAGLVLTQTLRVDNQSKENAVENAFGMLKSALREYYEGTTPNGFPVQNERNNPANALIHIRGLMQALLSVPASRQVLEQMNPSLVKTGTAGVPELRDPWGTEFDYVYVYDDKFPERSDSFPELISAGPDKGFGTADDISSKGRR